MPRISSLPSTRINTDESPIEVLEMTHGDIDKINEKLGLEELFNNAKTVGGISGCPQLQVIGGKMIASATSSDYEQ